MKSYFKIIHSCWECPRLGTDINGTRWECQESGDKFICWHGDKEKEETDYIPDWCSLSEYVDIFEEEK